MNQETGRSEALWHIPIAGVICCCLFVFCVFVWFIWLFGGVPQQRSYLLNYLMPPLVITLIPAVFGAILAAFLPIPRKFKLIHISATLGTPLLYFAFQAIRLFSAP